MKKIILNAFLFITMMSYGQITLIPDAEFEEFLVTLGIDTDGIINGQVATADIENVTDLALYGNGIFDLTGIEDFAALQMLEVYDTAITEIDLSQNLQLVYLDITYNALQQLDISNNTQLEILKCGNILTDVGPWNKIVNLDLSNNTQLREVTTSFMTSLETLTLGNHPNLTVLEASYNAINTLDFSSTPNLERLNLGQPNGKDFLNPSNNLSELDLSNNPNLEVLYIYDTTIEDLNLQSGNNEILNIMLAILTPNLFCIQVDDATAGNNGEQPYGSWNVSNQANYSKDCTLGVNGQNRNAFTLFPNPSDNWISIISNDEVSLKSVQLYDSFGRVVLTEAKNFDQINISLLSSGLFFAEIKTDLNTQIHKFIKK